MTVLDPECTQADAWATALMALGDRHAPAVAAEQGLMALFILRTAEGFHEQASPALASSALWQPQP